MEQQTAVSWLQIQLRKGIDFNPLDPLSYAKAVDNLFEQAKQMEKEQIINAWRNGDNDSMYNSRQLDNDAEQYYNETFVK